VVPSCKLTGYMRDSSDCTITNNRYYFRLTDVQRAFNMVVLDVGQADALAAAWAMVHAEYMIEDRVVAMPKGFKYPRLEKRRFKRSDVEPDWELLSSRYGLGLIRFTDGLLLLIAASSPEARKQLDDLGVDYGHKQIDDPVELNKLIQFLRGP